MALASGILEKPLVSKGNKSNFLRFRFVVLVTKRSKWFNNNSCCLGKLNRMQFFLSSCHLFYWETNFCSCIVKEALCITLLSKLQANHLLSCLPDIQNSLTCLFLYVYSFVVKSGAVYLSWLLLQDPGSCIWTCNKRVKIILIVDFGFIVPKVPCMCHHLKTADLNLSPTLSICEKISQKLEGKNSGKIVMRLLWE